MVPPTTAGWGNVCHGRAVSRGHWVALMVKTCAFKVRFSTTHRHATPPPPLADFGHLEMKLHFFLRVVVGSALLEKFGAVGPFPHGGALRWVLKEAAASAPLGLKDRSRPRCQSPPRCPPKLLL